MRLIIDGNSLLNAALLRGEDHDHGRQVAGPDGETVQVNGAQYGIDGFFDKYAELLKEFDAAPRDTIVCWDGPNAKSRRRAYLARYKEGRDKAPEVNEQLNLARDAVIQMLRDLGAHTAVQPAMEADDVIAYFTRTLRDERNVVCTSDGDLTVLHDENTDVWRLGELNKNPYGPFPHRFITLYKAIVGDSGDKIPGAAGFGDSAWVDLVRIFQFDGLELLEGLVMTDKLDALKEDIADFPKLQKIIDSKDLVAVSWRCATLHDHDVNTMRKPLTLTAGMVKPWAAMTDDRRVHALRHFYGTSTLVHAGNYEEAKLALAGRLTETPFFALDIETSSSEESDEWVENLMRAKVTDRESIDVLGHELCGMSITFGQNTQHTIYMTVDHVETDMCKNIPVDQCREMVEMLPQAKHIVIQNRSFEFSVLYRTWGDKWMENGWHGFVPNAVDTKVGAAYVNENLAKGLKDRSLHHLGYQQQTYEATTTKRGPVGSLTGGLVKEIYAHELTPAVMAPNPKSTEDLPFKDIVVTPAVTEQWERRVYKMNELRAAEVTSYGCDDTICTAALHTHYKLVMDLEKTWGVYLQVEQLPQYLTSLAFVQGAKINLAKLREMEKRDDIAYDAAWATLRAFLLAKGWEGTVCPEFEGDIEPSDVKLAVSIICPGVEFTSKKRKLNSIAVDLREQLTDSVGVLLADVVEQNDVATMNKLVRERFTGEPQINFGSPKQMQNLFYNVIGIKPRHFNAMTEKQREDDVMRSAFKKMRLEKAGKAVEFTDDERAALRSKASTDDDVVKTALARDTLADGAKAVLKAFQTVRTIMTRRSLFYATYRAAPHWRDGRVHASLNQCQAVTLRYSCSGPNLQQLIADGEGAEIREIIEPHKKSAVVVSNDWSGQELRLMAEQSGDVNLTACFVGDNLKDVHSLTAVAASIYLWDAPIGYDEFLAMLKSDDPAVRMKAEILRKNSKTVNFATQYGAMAPNIAQQLMVEEEVAQQFIDAKAAAFPRIDPWKKEVEELAAERGFAVTMLGARRHLRDALMSENQWDRMKADRQASNFRIQGSGAEQAKLAMSEMWRRGIFTGKYDAQFIAPVHDEVVYSVDGADAEACIKDVHECMVQPYADMSIPIVSSISLGRSFGHQIKCGEFYDLAKVRAALDQIFKKEEATA